MRLDDFNYRLPDSLIAQHPLHHRDKARLMVIDRARQSIVHDVFSNIGLYLPKKSCLILNDSKVVPARLLGKREQSGGKVEVFLLKKLSDGYCYETLMRPLRRLKVGEKIIFNNGSLMAKIEDRENRIVRFNTRNISAYLSQSGHMPLPPYIKRPDDLADREYYQTVYARREGSVASPTAGLHFTQRLLNRIKNAGHQIEKVTLHINYATFKPVEVTDITTHPMHYEDYTVTEKTLVAIKRAKKNGRKIVAIGTTSCRVLETVAQSGQRKGSTNLFIYPGYQFTMTDALITNFHLPHSTLLMLVYAFGSKSLMTQAYRQAVREKYRFYSYGDAMLII